jgi:hypothetical protein
MENYKLFSMSEVKHHYEAGICLTEIQIFVKIIIYSLPSPVGKSRPCTSKNPSATLPLPIIIPNMLDVPKELINPTLI